MHYNKQISESGNIVKTIWKIVRGKQEKIPQQKKTHQ
jgi:hypothetical protein